MEFLKTFTPELTVLSPGRINLIGEHTDYNMGYVLPTAIEKGIRLKFQKNGSDSRCRVYSETFDTGFELDLNAIARSGVEWENYILGVLNEISKRTDDVLQTPGESATIENTSNPDRHSEDKDGRVPSQDGLIDRLGESAHGADASVPEVETGKIETQGPSRTGNVLGGFDCVLQSDLPTGSGLSSSAALECGLAFGLNELFDLGLSKLQMIQLSQAAEHTYVGTQCGIMDQFASVMSKTGHVILLDCRTLDHDYIPIELHPYKIILLNTKVSHNLASSEYNTRKRECEQGVRTIQRKYPKVKSLRDVTEEMLHSSGPEMDPVIYNRCRFIVAENERVLEMANALRENDLASAGKVLYAAHEGISKLYEVSCAESDFLVEFSKGFTDVLGARQTGGGFGGCTLNVVHQDAVDNFVTAATKAYKKEFDIELEAFEVKPSGGTTLG